MTVELHHGDCLEVLKSLPSGSVDAVIADLPYGTTACKWDTIIPFALLWTQYRRIIRRGGAIALTASQPFTAALVMSNPDWFRYEWIWEKQQATGFLDVRRKPLKAHESVCIFYESQPTYNPQGLVPVSVNNARRNKGGNGVYGRVNFKPYTQTEGNFPRSVLRIDRVTHSQKHQTQKPVELMDYLVRTYTNEGETVLDNTMGSGTTGVACMNTGRNFIGVEIDAGYFAIAQRRIEQARQDAESKLFQPA